MQATTKRTLFTADAKFAVNREADKPVTLTGYAMVWNVLSSDRGGYQVRLMPGSAKFETPTFALLDHDFGKVIGSTANGSLRLKPDDYGVKVEIDLPSTTYGNDAATNVSSGLVTGMSFSMVTYPDGRSVRENGVEILEVTSFTADEVTITAIPAFRQTAIGPKPEGAEFSANKSAINAMRLQQMKFDELRLGMLTPAL